ncbi:MAG: helix-turn-helix domain-containing protein [Rhodospirillaceae bacterium]
MDGAARRHLIIETVTPLFARKGFAGVTTREIAKAAGVSEALVFRHFPTKAALYEEILRLGCQGDPDLARLETLSPSTDTLVLLTYGMIRHIVLGELGDKGLMTTRLRLVSHSILEDGDYARIHFADVSRYVQAIFIASIEAARQAGDLRPCRLSPVNAFWFVEHLAAQMAYGLLPEAGVFSYQGELDAVLLEAAQFVLRGIGLKDELVVAPFDLARLCVLSGTK